MASCQIASTMNTIMKGGRLLLVACSLPLLPSLSLAQTHRSPAASDQQIRTQIDAIIHSEHAFDGMSITPTVARGVVTLSGTVSSQAAKVLASTEIANVDGIKTVLNNLNVVSGSAINRPAIIPMQPLAAQGLAGPKVVSVSQNTVIPVRIAEEITTMTAAANDIFHGTTASAVVQNGYTVIPTGTAVSGRVITAKAAGFHRNGRTVAGDCESPFEHAKRTSRRLRCDDPALKQNNRARYQHC